MLEKAGSQDLAFFFKMQKLAIAKKNASRRSTPQILLYGGRYIAWRSLTMEQAIYRLAQ
jgi:hypothetical protein